MYKARKEINDECKKNVDYDYQYDLFHLPLPIRHVDDFMYRKVDVKFHNTYAAKCLQLRSMNYITRLILQDD